MSPPWALALDDHADAVNWMGTEIGIVATGYAMLGGEMHQGLIEGGLSFKNDIKSLVGEARRFFLAAETYWVSSDMASLIEHAAGDEKLLDQVLRPEDLPSRSGFLFFDSPVSFGSAFIRSLSWYSVKGQVVFWCWENREDRRKRDDEGWSWVGDGSFDDQVFQGTRVIPINQWPWSFGDALAADVPLNLEWAEDEEGRAVIAEETKRERMECLSLVYCVLLMLGQKITRSEEFVAPRATAKRAARAGLPKTVRCITLRREQILGHGESEGDSGRPINYSHRFMVSGHWKPQWYPSLQDHRLIYIAPYIKGPEDKPLIIRDTVYALRR